MSFRLLGIAQRKNSAVTTRKGTSRPAGISGASMSSPNRAPPDPTGPVEMLNVHPFYLFTDSL
jgi:hypothetical protein